MEACTIHVKYQCLARTHIIFSNIYKHNIYLYDCNIYVLKLFLILILSTYFYLTYFCNITICHLLEFYSIYCFGVKTLFTISIVKINNFPNSLKIHIRAFILMNKKLLDNLKSNNHAFSILNDSQ